VYNMSMKTEKLYQNKEWLQQKYIREKLSTGQIGKLCEIDALTVGYWLKKYNIPIRSTSESTHLGNANHCNLSQEAIEWINGELLGDGCLNSSSIYSARFQYTSKYLEYINYISNTLDSFGIKQAGKINKYYHKKMNCYTYRYSSLCYEELLPIYKHWYPKGIKIMPKDIKLTPLTCKHWYIGDGSLEHQKEGGKPRIRLWTYGFSILNVNWLTKQLNNLGFKAIRQPSRNSIGISTYSTKDFLNYIGKCPVECYQYKWAY